MGKEGRLRLCAQSVGATVFVLSLFANFAWSDSEQGELKCNQGDRACEQTRAAMQTAKARQDVFENLDARSVTSIQVKCAKDRALLGGLLCEDKPNKPGFYTTIERELKALLAKRNTDYYRGVRSKAPGVMALSALPVCNIMGGEGDGLAQIQDTDTYAQRATKNHNWLYEAGNDDHNASYCGEPYGMRIETGLVSATMHFDDKRGHGNYEYGQYRGSVLQVTNFHKEKVLSMLRTGNLALVEIEGSYPCQEAAADLVRSQNAIDKITREVVVARGSADEVAKLKCPFEGSGEKGTGYEGQNVPKIDGTALDPVSNAACRMTLANMELQAMWTNVLDCEIHWRATRDFEDHFGDQARFIEDLKNHMKPRCQEAGDCKKNGKSQCDGLLCCNDELRTKLWNQCYRKAMPGFLKEKLQPWKTSTPVEVEHSGRSSDARQLPLDLMGNLIFAIGSLGIRRGRRKSLNSAVSTFVIAAFAVVQAACSCDDNGAACQPCKAPNEQTRGCLYKACMQALYICFETGHSNNRRQNTNNAAGTDNVGVVAHNTSLDDSKDNVRCYSPDFAAFRSAAASQSGEGTLPNLFAAFNGAACPFHSTHSCGAVGRVPSRPVFNSFRPAGASGGAARDAVRGTTMGNIPTHSANGLAPDRIAPDEHGCVSLLDEIAQASLNSITLGRFVADHHLANGVTVKAASDRCAQLVGMPQLGKTDEYNSPPDATHANTSLNTSSATSAEQKAFNDAITEFMAADGAGGARNGMTGSADDPSCTSHDPESHSGPQAAAHGDGVAQDLADTRPLFGGNNVAAAGGSGAQNHGNTNGNAATAAERDKVADNKTGRGGGGHSPDTSINLGRSGSGAPTGTAAASAGDSSGGVPKINIGGLGSNDAQGVDGPSGAALNQSQAFETAGSGGGGAGSKRGSGTGAEGGGTTGVSNADLGLKAAGDAAGAGGVNEEGILRDSKLSLFEIVNRRTEKFSNTLDR